MRFDFAIPIPAPSAVRRFIGWVKPLADSDYGAVRITVGRHAHIYLLRGVPTDLGPNQLGYQLEKLDEQMQVVTVYHVLLDARDGYSSCDCLGYLRHGHCKHVAGILTLRQATPGAFPGHGGTHNGLCSSCRQPLAAGRNAPCHARQQQPTRGRVSRRDRSGAQRLRPTLLGRSTSAGASLGSAGRCVVPTGLRVAAWGPRASHI